MSSSYRWFHFHPPRRLDLHKFSLALPLLFSPLSLRAQPALEGRLIVIDAGHGVINFEGKIINPGQENTMGHKEHKLTLEISRRLGEQLQQEGATVVYTRTPSDYWRQSYSTIEDNESRAYFANELGAEAYLSIHCDWNTSRKVTGVTTIYAKSNSARLGNLIHRNMIQSLKVRDRKLVCDSFTVLDKAEMPAVIIETGFLSNRIEAKKLASPIYQKKIAQAITKGIKKYFSK